MPPVENKPAPSNTYSKQEANAKALLTTKDWIKTYDGLSEDVLNQKSKNYFDGTTRLNELKAKTNRSKEEEMELNHLLVMNIDVSNNNLLKDNIARLKSYDYEKVYNVLKDLYAQYPKTDVDKLMGILPNFLSGRMVGDDFKYSYDLWSKLTMDDKLYLNDIYFDKKFNDALQQKYPKTFLTKTAVTIESNTNKN